MEPRKVQKTGYNSLSLTLLKQWTANQKIQHGDTLYCREEDDGTMRLIPGNLAQELDRKIESYYEIALDSYREPVPIGQMIISNYIMGRNHIAITSSQKLSNRQLGEIRSTMNHLMGMGIMEENSHQVALQVALDRTQFTLSSLLKRFYQLIALMLTEAIESIAHLDQEAARNVIQREIEADKLYWLIARLIHTTRPRRTGIDTRVVESTMELMGNRAVARDIGVIGDSAEAIATEVIRMRELGLPPPPKQVYEKILEIHGETESLLREAMAALLSRDLAMAKQALSRQVKTRSGNEALCDSINWLESPSRNTLSLQVLAIQLRNISSAASSIATMAIDRSLESLVPD